MVDLPRLCGAVVAAQPMVCPVQEAACVRGGGNGFAGCFLYRAEYCDDARAYLVYLPDLCGPLVAPVRLLFYSQEESAIVKILTKVNEHIHINENAKNKRPLRN